MNGWMTGILSAESGNQNQCFGMKDNGNNTKGYYVYIYLGSPVYQNRIAEMKIEFSP